MARQNGGQGSPASEREAGIIAAYLAGAKWSEIEERFGVGRSTISHVLRRSNVLPSRTRRKLDQESADLALAGLYELIKHQDQVIVELEALKVRYEAKLRRHGITFNGTPSRKKAARPDQAV